ncbi:hypothetical protein BC943DRAFT_356006 [Umbelopsis sp. AD052]|nr:hypothetical protein BC943DRAFT_356006 [Umbelopsis sp. AD052]
MSNHPDLIDAINSTYDSPLQTHELEIIREAIGAMGWSTPNIVQFLRTKQSWKSPNVIAQAIIRIQTTQEQGVSVPIATTARQTAHNSTSSQSPSHPDYVFINQSPPHIIANGLRPDIVVIHEKEVIMLDVVFTSQHQPDAPNIARRRKQDKYSNLALQYQLKGFQVTNDAIAFGDVGHNDWRTIILCFEN